MDVVTTSLDALLQRATNPQNQNVDVAAVEAFCALINKEKDGVNIGIKLIASRIHSTNEKEVLQTLNILDTCMLRCGTSFQSEIGKFRFLNEMIKLVSPKYLGSQTPLSIKQKVLQLMYVWTLDYPKESKIKEAYDMLKKQGVIKEVPALSVSADVNVPERRMIKSIFQDEEKSKLLQKLLQSKNPDDLQAANRLIKSMVKEDDKRAELKSKKIAELESVNNNVRLLNEMLDSYKPGKSSDDELELIKELHQSCERLRLNVFKLASETQQNEDMLNEILQASDELGRVFEKYKKIMKNDLGAEKCVEVSHSSNLSLLDLENHDSDTNHIISLEKISNTQENDCQKSQNDVDILCDIFTNVNIPETDAEILQPSSVLSNSNVREKNNEKSNSKQKALEDLDILGEHLLKENLPSNIRLGQQFNKNPEKIPMNLLPTVSENKIIDKGSSNTTSNVNFVKDELLNFDLSFLENKNTEQTVQKQNDKNDDDCLVNVNDDVFEKSDKLKKENENSMDNVVEEKKNEQKSINSKNELKLNDIFVNLENIKPSAVPPLTIFEKNAISVILHFAQDKPREDVNVYVVTTVSKNKLPLNSYLFRAVVPQKCKLKLQNPSNTELPAFNPFLPPSAITQIMLIANPEGIQISLKFILSYTMDEETITEIGEVDSLPMQH